MLRRLFLAALVALLPAAAAAQTSPNWPFGYVPTIAEWNAIFASKADFTGSVPITAAGGTMTGKLNFLASSSGTAGMNCGVGTTPSSPLDGDIWCTTSGMFVRINGSTIALGTAGGTLAVTAGGTGQTSFTANLPILGNGTSALAQGTRSGNTTQFATVTGTLTSGDCLSYDASGNIHSAGVGACGGSGGSGTVASASSGQLAIYTAATTVSGLAGCNNGYFGTNGGGTVSCITTLNTTLSQTIVQVGTITTGTWNATVVAGQYGGTGVANTGNTITLNGNNFAITGAAITLTAVGATNVTLPTTGTLLNQNGTSGGIPYYSTSTSVASSAALTANLPVLGGGAGSAPVSGARQGNTTTYVTYSGSAPSATNNCAAFDGSGATANLKDSGVVCGASSAAPVLLATLTASTSASLTDVGNCGTGGSTGCFTASYSSYRLDFNKLVISTASSTTNVGCQIAVWNGSYQTSGYVTAGGSTTYLPCWPTGAASGAQTMADPGISGSVTVFSPSAVGKAMWNGVFTVTTGAAAGSAGQNFTGGWWNTAAALSGFRVCFGTAGGTCSVNILTGTIKVYGIP